jgi:hypothetical protein
MSKTRELYNKIIKAPIGEGLIPTPDELDIVIKFADVDVKTILDEFRSLCDQKDFKECLQHLSYYDDIIDNISEDEENRIYSEHYQLMKGINLIIIHLHKNFSKFTNEPLNSWFKPDYNIENFD